MKEALIVINVVTFILLLVNRSWKHVYKEAAADYKKLYQQELRDHIATKKEATRKLFNR